MATTELVTKTGKNDMLYGTFASATQITKYGFMGIGTNGGSYNTTDLSLGQECNVTDNLGYARVTTTNTFETETNDVKLEGVFDINNITNDTTINEVGICDTSDLGETTNWFCLCKISPITKNSNAQLRIVITVTVV